MAKYATVLVHDLQFAFDLLDKYTDYYWNSIKKSNDRELKEAFYNDDAWINETKEMYLEKV